LGFEIAAADAAALADGRKKRLRISCFLSVCNCNKKSTLTDDKSDCLDERA
jgi:hypothetical protein